MVGSMCALNNKDLWITWGVYTGWGPYDSLFKFGRLALDTNCGETGQEAL